MMFEQITSVLSNPEIRKEITEEFAGACIDCEMAPMKSYCIDCKWYVETDATIRPITKKTIQPNPETSYPDRCIKTGRLTQLAICRNCRRRCKYAGKD